MNFRALATFTAGTCLIAVCFLDLPDKAGAYPTLPISTAPNATIAFMVVRNPMIHPGENVYLSISEKNVSASPVTIPAGVDVWHSATLSIRDALGQKVNSNIPREGGGGTFTGHMGFIEPNETFTFEGEKSSNWARLANWGYRLDKPGKYFVSACTGYRGGTACTKPQQVTVSDP